MVLLVLLRLAGDDDMKRILTLGAMLILPLNAIWAQQHALGNGDSDESASDRVFDYIEHVRDLHEGNTTPSPAAQRQSRKEILEALSPLLTTRDTPRGVVVSVPPTEFESGKLRPATAEKVAQVAAMVVAHPGVRVVVEGYTESNGEVAQGHAEAVRTKLIDTGVNPQTASAVGYIKSRLTASANSDNGRVEIVISGPAIGTSALSAGRNSTLISDLR
jgi:outer membrane protein OmpA-like peptidoglycan-associated protein